MKLITLHISVLTEFGYLCCEVKNTSHISVNREFGYLCCEVKNTSHISINRVWVSVL